MAMEVCILGRCKLTFSGHLPPFALPSELEPCIHKTFCDFPSNRSSLQVDART